MGRSAAQSSEDERLYDHRARRDKRNKKLLERRLELLREQRFMVVPGSDEDKQLCATILELLRSEPDDQ
jgi:shikimate kinase